MRASSARAGGMVGGGATHAWVQVFLPGAGWIEYDPTNALIGGRNLIRVGVARDASQAVPLAGTYTGNPGRLRFDCSRSHGNNGTVFERPHRLSCAKQRLVAVECLNQPRRRGSTQVHRHGNRRLMRPAAENHTPSVGEHVAEVSPPRDPAM